MRYQLAPISTRPWLLSGLSLRLIESHYEFHVGCKTAIALRDAGFDAKYMNGGHSAWKAIGGPIKLYT